MVKKQHTSNPCPGAETEEQQCVSGSCTTPQLARQHCVIQICHQSSMRSLPPSLEHFCPLFMIFEAIYPDGVSFGLDRVSFFPESQPHLLFFLLHRHTPLKDMYMHNKNLHQPQNNPFHWLPWATHCCSFFQQTTCSLAPAGLHSDLVTVDLE